MVSDRLRHYHDTHEKQNRCPRCGGTDTVKIGAFNPGDSDETMKCLDCEKEWEP